MNKIKRERIDDNIETFNIPVMPVFGGEQLHPDHRLVKRAEEYFQKHFTNWRSFRLSEIENERWYYFDDTKKWVQLGNSVQFQRKRRPHTLKRSQK